MTKNLFILFITLSGFLIDSNQNSTNYCQSMGTDTTYEHIQQVSVHSINNISGNNHGYADFTDQKTELVTGKSYEIYLTPGYKDNKFSESWNIWIDYNHNGNFDDDGEHVVSTKAIGPTSSLIYIPEESLTNTELIMRVSMKYNDASLPCQIYTYGEVEDYTVILTDKESPCIDDISDGFEYNYGNWNDGSTDCTRVQEHANTGSWSVRLRDNSGASSSLTSNILDLSEYKEISIDFSYYPYSMEDGEDFWLQISTDAGQNFKTINTWVSGIDFYNNKRYHASITIKDIRFSNETLLRLRCDASANADQVYIDDISIVACKFNDEVNILDEIEEQIPTASLPDVQNDNKIQSRDIKATQGKLKIELGIYPNPASEKISFKISENSSFDTEYNIRVVNLFGDVIKEKHAVISIDNYALDVSDLQNGMYMIVIIDSEGNKGTCKVMISQ